VLGFFILAWASLVTILIATPEVYDQALHLPASDRRLFELAFLAALSIFLEAVMNSIRNGLEMRKTGDCGGPSQPENAHPNAVFAQVHNTL
jgi:hypothetical protein